MGGTDITAHTFYYVSKMYLFSHIYRDSISRMFPKKSVNVADAYNTLIL